MAIAIILCMLTRKTRKYNRSPSFVPLMPPFLDCTERCKQGIHFDFCMAMIVVNYGIAF